MSQTPKTQDMNDAVATGGCQCGAVRYALKAKPSGAICHCRMCQKAVGGPFAALAGIAADKLTWTCGQPAFFNSSNMARRGFCSACGTPLTYSGLNEAMIEITIGSLDNPEAAPPREQNGVEARLSWFETLIGLPGTVTEPKFDGVISYQHPDHQTSTD